MTIQTVEAIYDEGIFRVTEPKTVLLARGQKVRLLVESVEEQEQPIKDTDLKLAFMKLSLAERRRILALQAKQLLQHYQQTAEEREDWQAGDFS